MGMRKSFLENYQSETQKMSRQLGRRRTQRKQRVERIVADSVSCESGLECKETSGSGVE